MSDIEFISGLSFKAPNENAPEYVKAKGSIKRLDLIAWLQTKDGEWVNFDLKVSQSGKWYAAVDNWKPNAGKPERPARTGGGGSTADMSNDELNDMIPFASNQGIW